MPTIAEEREATAKKLAALSAELKEQEAYLGRLNTVLELYPEFRAVTQDTGLTAEGMLALPLGEAVRMLYARGFKFTFTTLSGKVEAPEVPAADGKEAR